MNWAFYNPSTYVIVNDISLQRKYNTLVQTIQCIMCYACELPALIAGLLTMIKYT